MEFFAALGIGANILQVIDYGYKIVKHTKSIIENGATTEHDYLERTARDLVDVIDGLARQGITGAYKKSGDESAAGLPRLAHECKSEAQALVERIRTYSPESRDGIIGRLSSFRKSVKLCWEKNEVDALEARLHGYRMQLSTRMLAILNEKSDSQGADVVEILSLTRTINSKIEAVGAVLQDANGTFRTVLNGSMNIESEKSPDTITYRKASPTSESAQSTSEVNGHIPSLVSSTRIHFHDVAQEILEALWFRFSSARESGIDEAFTRTFEWLFQEPDRDERVWSNFPAWLEKGAGCYWVNGKAGSGKSTLMKYVGKHSALMKSLKVWAGDDDLLVSTFFFWRAGQDLQKSQEGLLRSLLYQILSRRRELLTVCFPELCHRLTQTAVSTRALTIDFEDLKTAFSRLFKHPIPKTKVFLLVDGLDEYQGDYRSLSNLIIEATECDTTKALVSSRPVPLLVQAFADYPSLEVQNLTMNDIRLYTTKNLVQDRALREMEILEPGVSAQLVENIVTKANGVFLWVVLVVRKVLEGLANYDTKEGLLRALEGLPIDLEQLYAHMFNSMSLTYREEASLIMQLFVRAEAVQFHYPVTALQLSFAEKQDLGDGPGERDYALDAAEADALCKRTEGRLRSRCCGLLEVQRSPWGVGDHKKYVGFLHRTVMDFFQRDEIWAKITSWNPVEREILDQRLLSSCVKEINQDISHLSHDPTRADAQERVSEEEPTAVDRKRASIGRPDFETRILHGVIYCAAVQARDGGRTSMFVQRLWQFYLALPPAIRRSVDNWAVLRTCHRSLDVAPAQFCQPALMFSAFHGLNVSDMYPEKSGCTEPQCCSLMLVNLLITLNDPPATTSPDQLARGIIGLLKRGVDVNTPALYYPPIDTANVSAEIKDAVRLSPNQHGDLIPWIYWLSCKQSRSEVTIYHPELYVEVLEQMIAAGASLEERLGGASRPRSETISAVIEECLQLLHDGTVQHVRLRNQIQSHLHHAQLVRRRTLSEASTTSASSWKLRFKPFRRSTYRT